MTHPCHPPCPEDQQLLNLLLLQPALEQTAGPEQMPPEPRNACVYICGLTELQTCGVNYGKNLIQLIGSNIK